MTSTLNDATEPAPAGTITSSPEEFAAAWNNHSAKERADFLRRHNASADEAQNCWMRDHAARIEYLETQLSESNATIEKLRALLAERSILV